MNGKTNNNTYTNKLNNIIFIDTIFKVADVLGWSRVQTALGKDRHHAAR